MIVFSAQELGHIVREARKFQNLTQEDLAGMTGTGRRFISELENGKATVQLGKTLQVLGTLGVALSVIQHWKS